jgi:hypothetical protein
MGRRMKAYLAWQEAQSTQALSPDEKEYRIRDLLVQISFFQHERLIHLLVTLAFALFTLLTLFVCCFIRLLPLYLLMTLFLALLIPYIRHYFILENGVQRLYQYYDGIAGWKA